ncbi:MAG: cytochrome c family protein [Rhodospirillales bacterium]|nr:cytochrome c family protein [Rhodospirillales bacterium]
MISRKFALGLALAAAVTVVPGLAFADCKLAGDADAGKTVANGCKSCHEFAADKASKATGPNLHDVYGAKAGGRGDFAKYSEALKAAAAKVTWDDASIDAYLTEPKDFLAKVNGKDMKHAMFYKVADGEKRKQVIAFLKAIKGNKDCP